MFEKLAHWYLCPRFQISALFQNKAQRGDQGQNKHDADVKDKPFQQRK